MLRIFRTRDALRDLDGIWDYIAANSPNAADRFLDQLEQRFLMLAEYPLMGELQPLLADGTYRRFVYGNYVIYYRPEENAVTIVQVLHGARDEQTLF